MTKDEALDRLARARGTLAESRARRSDLRSAVELSLVFSPSLAITLGSCLNIMDRIRLSNHNPEEYDA